MRRALELADNSRGTASPNPMVGCVIVYADKIIGEGWTQAYGGPHAEVHAIHQVSNLSLLPHSIAYVTLEPCAHFGKTPPCADLLAKHRLKKVVVACTDPNPLVAGKGIDKLKKSGVDVEVGLMKKEALDFNRRFFTSIESARPYVILKWAQTADGFIARANYDAKWISNTYSRKLVHQWRAEEDAIMVGTHTARYDDPILNVRDWVGKDPVRIVIDKQLSLDKNLNLFSGHQSTLCYNLLENSTKENLTLIKLEEEDFLGQLMKDLHTRKIQSIIVEGGTLLLQSFINSSIWDEARIFTSDVVFHKGIQAPQLKGKLTGEENIMGDQLEIYKNQ